MQKYSEIVATTKADGTVEVLPGATVTVYLTGTTTLASLYSDNGITTKANPFQSAALTGRIEFYAADGRYDIKIDKAGYTTVTVADILIEDPEDIGVLEDVTLVDATISTSTVTNSTLSQCILVNTEIQDVDSLQLTNTPPAVLQPRMLSWNNDEGTADLSLLDGTVLQMGQELHYRARNNTASTIADGAVVWATGTSGATGRINVGLAVADGSQPGKTVMGLMTHATAAGSDGYVANFGKVRGINTTGSAVGETWVNGDILYLHPTIPGALTKVKPAVNGHIVVTVAIVIYAGNNGTLFARPTADSQEADEIRYTPAGTGAVATTVQSKLRETVSVFDFMTSEQIADVQSGTASIDVTTALQAAVDTQKHLYWPSGTYKISGTVGAGVTGLGASYGSWFGDGETKTIIQTTGTNSGAAFLKPPTQWSGMAVRGDARQGTGVQMGENGAFAGLIHWSDIRVSNFDLAVDCYNFFICKWDSIYILSNNNGVRCIPTDSVGVDDGYFTTWEWSNVIVGGYGFNAPGYALLCEPALGGRLFHWSNVSFEKHGYGGSVSAMVILRDTSVVGKNVYLEKSPVPAINNRFSNITLENVYMNGTLGVTVGTAASQAYGKTHLKNASWITADDRTFYISSGVSGSEIVFENSGSIVPTLTGNRPDRLIYINSGGYSFFSRYPKNIAGTEGNIRLGGTAASLNDIRCYTRTVTATVPANGTVDLITDSLVLTLWEAGVVGVASITSSYQPNILLTVTPATSGSADYFCVQARNLTASPITLTSQQLSVVFYKHTGVAI